MRKNRHQKQALTFMLNRELGWSFQKNDDIWEVRDTHRGLQYVFIRSIYPGMDSLRHTDMTIARFVNRISGAVERDEPPPFRGGIIADPMVSS